jgi:aldehyde:ferredoxin oxidoreductase
MRRRGKMVLGGFAGTILRVNLKSKKVTKEPLKEDQARKYLGGPGLATKILFDELKPGIDPLGPENKLILTAGVMAGTLCEGGGSWQAVTKSPLTGLWAAARSGGFFGPEMKYAGYDMIILEGRAEKPCYLWVCNDLVEIRDAGDSWGKPIPEAEALIKEELGEYQARLALIGPAGEKLVRFAAIMNDMCRAAGRCGVGAVMGSKNVKAVVVRGTKDVKVNDPETCRKALIEMEKAVRNNPLYALYAYEGTPAYTGSLNAFGALPTWHDRSGYFDRWENVSVDTLRRNYLVKARACQACSYGCERYTEIKFGAYRTPPMGGPEYETIDLMGPYLKIDNLEAIARASYLCNIYGMDTISTGYMIAFAIECFERGLITLKETGGLKLSWGDPEILINLTEKIATRQGIGDLLAEGVVRVAEKLGKEAINLALHVKGLEQPGHSPRAIKEMALQYGTCNRGACHIRYHWVGNPSMFKATSGMEAYGLPDPSRLSPLDEVKEKAKIVVVCQNCGNVHEALGTCLFHTSSPNGETGLTIKRFANLLSSLTGWEISDHELVKAGERLFNLERAFNIREGVRRKDDIIAERWRTEKLLGGPTEGAVVENYERMLDWYYELRGWDSEGVPRKSKLMELELGEVITHLEAIGVSLKE